MSEVSQDEDKKKNEAADFNLESYLNGMLERTLLLYDSRHVEKMRNTVVAIAGLGGVGAITAEFIARWGVKKIRLMDKDRYDESNLNRQLFATSKTLGRYKVDVAEERILEINPGAEIEMKICDSVDNDNARKFLKGAGILIQTADSPSCRVFYIAARELGVPVVNGYSTIIGARVQSYDYRSPSVWFQVEEWKDRIKGKKRKDTKDISEMTREELAELDSLVMHPAMPTANYVTNIAGAMIVCEAVKLITGTGKVVRYPWYIDLDLYNNKMGVKNLYSPFRMENFKKIFGKTHGEDFFQNVISEARRKGKIA